MTLLAMDQVSQGQTAAALPIYRENLVLTERTGDHAWRALALQAREVGTLPDDPLGAHDCFKH